MLLGHVRARKTRLAAVKSRTDQNVPDVAIVIVSDPTEHSPDMIGKLIHEAVCPVIALVDVEDGAFIRDAARRGVFRYLASVECGVGDVHQFAAAVA